MYGNMLHLEQTLSIDLLGLPLRLGVVGHDT
jgi:hypothetical protein